MSRKLASLGLTAVAVPALAAAAIAQTPSAPAEVDVTAKVTPSKGGTKKKPVNAGWNIKFDINADSNSTLSGISYGIPKSLRISGAGFPKCSADTINNEGESGCPKKAKVGTGAATALVGSQPIRFKINVYANGAKRLTLALQQVDGDVNVPFSAKITRSRVTFDIPQNIQQPVPGLYSFVTSVTAKLGKAKIRKGGKTYFLVSRVGCVGGKDTTGVRLPLTANPTQPAEDPINGSDSSSCKK